MRREGRRGASLISPRALPARNRLFTPCPVSLLRRVPLPPPPPRQFFTVLFAVPRIVGYCAHWRESLADPDTKIIRPQQVREEGRRELRTGGYKRDMGVWGLSGSSLTSHSLPFFLPDRQSSLTSAPTRSSTLSFSCLMLFSYTHAVTRYSGPCSQDYRGVWLRHYEGMDGRSAEGSDTLSKLPPSNAYQRRVKGENWQ